MREKYPKIDLFYFLYPNDLPGVDIKWDLTADPFFPEREDLKNLPHWKVFRPVMKKLRIHLRRHPLVMVAAAQLLICQDDLGAACAKAVKEYPKKRWVIFKTLVRGILAFPSTQVFAQMDDLRLSFWCSPNGLERARRFYREIPLRKAYLSALKEQHPEVPVSDMFWDPHLELQELSM